MERIKRSETIGYKISLLHNQIHKNMEAKRMENEDNLPGMQRWNLGFLKDHSDCEVYQKDIEEAFSISRATASNMLAVMERKGLIERAQVSHDARLKRLVLTDKMCIRDRIREFKKDSLLTPVFMILEVFMETIIPVSYTHLDVYKRQSSHAASSLPYNAPSAS